MRKKLTKIERLSVENEVLKKTISYIKEKISTEPDIYQAFGSISTIVKYKENLDFAIKTAEWEKGNNDYGKIFIIKGDNRMTVTLNPSKTKFYNFLKVAPEVKAELPSMRKMEYYKSVFKDCTLSFWDSEKGSERIYKLMAIAGTPFLIINERELGEDGKEEKTPITTERLECFGLISRT